MDARSDVFSFGAVLYEMATGRRAFAGTSTAEVLAALMKDRPKPIAEVAPSVPRELERVIERCLRKDADRRFQHMLDVKLELEQIKEDWQSRAVVGGPALSARPQRARGVILLLSAIVVAVALSVLSWRQRQRPGATISPPRIVPLTAMRGFEEGPTFSPDGAQVAFSWTGETTPGNVDVYVS